MGTKSKKILVITILILILSATLLTSISQVPEVQATFPGKKNGKIVFERTFADKNGKTQHQIFIMNPDGHGLVQLTYKGWNVYPRWSADGKKIIFSSNRTGMFQIYTMQEDGSGQIRITHDNTHDYWEACWSPDGTKIVCTGGFLWTTPPTYLQQICVMNADGTNLRPLTYGSGSNWSPDGTKIAFQDNGCGSGAEKGIYVINPDGIGRTPLFITYSCSFRPCWSPNGIKIMFTQCVPYVDMWGQSIFVMDADGSNPYQLNIPSTSTYDPSGCYWGTCWSPDGEKIAFSHGQSDGTTSSAWIYVMNPDGTGITQLTHHGSGIFDSFPDWQPRAAKAKG